MRLADALRAHGVESRFVVPDSNGGDSVAGFTVHRLAERKARALASALTIGGTRTVLVHFSGYGYDRRGLCWWLAEGLRLWRQEQDGRRLVTVFHELYANGPPWRTSFWTSWPQRTIARRLFGISDAAFTTSSISAAKLTDWRPDLLVRVTPVFSNVGECDVPAPLNDRGPFAVVFGKGERRYRVYAALADAPSAVGEGLRRIGVARVLDIGPPIATPDAVAGLPIERLGALGTSAVSARLAHVRVGFVDYPFHVLTKSGILAAYFAHGVLAVNTSRVGTLPDGIEEGRQFAHPFRLSEPAFDGQAVADEGFRWYRPHSPDGTARALLPLFS